MNDKSAGCAISAYSQPLVGCSSSWYSSSPPWKPITSCCSALVLLARRPLQNTAEAARCRYGFNLPTYPSSSTTVSSYATSTLPAPLLMPLQPEQPFSLDLHLETFPLTGYVDDRNEDHGPPFIFDDFAAGVASEYAILPIKAVIRLSMQPLRYLASEACVPLTVWTRADPDYSMRRQVLVDESVLSAIGVEKQFEQFDSQASKLVCRRTRARVQHSELGRQKNAKALPISGHAVVTDTQLTVIHDEERRPISYTRFCLSSTVRRFIAAQTLE
ncbi:hypothetical protein LTR56_021056 [Elasticomyces elasticus]|nr:hypothetical protein LTR56_021056 [Elasticomyces elasticus]KAK3635269.1 hypothetical protein LTR22_019265 [Elasticomyces elasticus]KAK4911639.1 hypothetical protein LTR49_019803 [Elasticomyces elasticus]KAK5748914.1 hypothetical protein LTS12_021019 [Elasticomyces elasticus]